MNCKFLLTATFVSASLFASAQQQLDKTYAITGKTGNSFFWADIKQIDIATGKVVKTLFEADKTTFTTNSLDKKITTHPTITNPMAYGVAACALDTRHNRLYFAPMHFSDIQYLDLSTNAANFTIVKKDVIQNITSTTQFQPEETQLTRMVFAADGTGYALSNDANHLISFTSGKNAEVLDLGKLTDAPSNKISIHDKASSWGGDMVADAFGKLVVITASHNVFSIDVNDKKATYLGSITGLPVKYTTNGAVVNSSGDLVVCSANVFDGLYAVNLQNLTAVKIVSTETGFNASDLANGNLLSQKQYDAAQAGVVTGAISANISKSTKIFPNPIVSNTFNVNFKNQPAGNYQVVFTDITGKLIQSNLINIDGGSTSQTKTILLNKKPINGTYMVKIINADKKTIATEKMIAN